MTIPKKSLEELGLKIGDQVSVTIEDQKVVITPRNLDISVNADTIAWTQAFIEKYRPALEALKDK